MSIEVRFTFRDLAEAQAFMNATAAYDAPAAIEAVPATTEQTETEKPKPRKPRTTKKPEPEPEQAKAEPAPEAEKADTKQPSLDDTREAAMQLKDARGMPAVVAVLKQFDATKVSEVPENARGEFIEACGKEVA